MHTPLNKVLVFPTLRHTFPRISQQLFLNKHLVAVRRHYLHFRLLSSHEKVNKDIRLSDDFYITINFKSGFKNIGKGEAI